MMTRECVFVLALSSRNKTNEFFSTRCFSVMHDGLLASIPDEHRPVSSLHLPLQNAFQGERYWPAAASLITRAHARVI